jgi:hypothetical protein
MDMYLFITTTKTIFKRIKIFRRNKLGGSLVNAYLDKPNNRILNKFEEN